MVGKETGGEMVEGKGEESCHRNPRGRAWLASCQSLNLVAKTTASKPSNCRLRWARLRESCKWGQCI